MAGCLARQAGSAWRWLRAVSGDDAYESYQRHHAARHPGEPLLSRGAYYEQMQRRKWSGVSRCC
ncbi:MAG: YbdD/YjiX family protein [Proteobacteria bacterium]|nr:YbdD/YjiX family protein [Pseudomonadota bacterium]